MSSATQDRVRRRQHDAELADADALGLHREIEVEQHRIVGNLETLDVEVMLGEAARRNRRRDRRRA